jgi:hypothetical protein
MTTDKIRNIDIVGYLSKCGITPKKETGKTAIYLSPLSDENEPSFTVNKAKNRFTCYSSGEKGSIIDFVMAYEKLDFKEAIKFLGGDNFSDIEQYVPIKKPPPGVKIHSIEELTDGELLDYACGVRKINEHVAKKYLKQLEISFPYSNKNNERTYKLLGFKSDGGGYECKNSWMRVCAGSKSHTTIKGESNNKCVVTEGLFDFLSYMTYYELGKPDYTHYCLNGATQWGALKAFIGDKQVLYYGDNDKNGDKIQQDIVNCEDRRILYPWHKDFNDFLISL